jgi:hypothetical protein
VLVVPLERAFSLSLVVFICSIINTIWATRDSKSALVTVESDVAAAPVTPVVIS